MKPLLNFRHLMRDHSLAADMGRMTESEAAWGLISCVHDGPRRWTPAEETARRITQAGLTDSQLRAIRRENALGLVPRLKRA